MITRLERWIIVGDGLSYSVVIIPSDAPLITREVLKLCRCQNAVISMFDALTNEFIGMAYASLLRPGLEVMRYGRRQNDENPYAF
jgi:hypothetical protein